MHGRMFWANVPPRLDPTVPIAAALVVVIEVLVGADDEQFHGAVLILSDHGLGIGRQGLAPRLAQLPHEVGLLAAVSVLYSKRHRCR